MLSVACTALCRKVGCSKPKSRAEYFFGGRSQGNFRLRELRKFARGDPLSTVMRALRSQPASACEDAAEAAPPPPDGDERRQQFGWAERNAAWLPAFRGSGEEEADSPPRPSPQRVLFDNAGCEVQRGTRGGKKRRGGKGDGGPGTPAGEPRKWRSGGRREH